MRLKLPLAVLLFSIPLTFACQNNIFQPQNTAPPAMREVPSVRLNYKYEPDVPPPMLNDIEVELDEQNRISVRSVRSGSPADKAGIMRGDTIISLNGEHIDNEFRNKVTGISSGVVNKILVIRDGSILEITVTGSLAEEKNAAVQTDFDSNRQVELLDRTLLSPDKKRVLAVYHRISDMQDLDHMDVFRLDMYSSDGRLLKKLTSDTMAVYFPETIVWSPDSGSLAFVAKTRAAQTNVDGTVTAPADNANTQLESSSDITGNTANSNSAPAKSSPTPPSPTGILTFRTQQIYICNADGNGLKTLTENEGLIYFYYTWSPDSSMLAALATSAREWKYLEISAYSKGEMMVPYGRPRIIEKNGRERRLDDNQTQIWPAWSPDSTKVAAAYDVEIPDAQNPNKKRRDTQIRIYDAMGTNPTQAAILLRNQLLISSLAYDRQQQKLAQSASNENTEAAPPPDPEQPLSTLPDENSLVSYNPIVEIAWDSGDLLYLKTAYLKRMPNAADNVTSFARWHRLVFLPQAMAPPK